MKAITAVMVTGILSASSVFTSIVSHGMDSNRKQVSSRTTYVVTIVASAWSFYSAQRCFTFQFTLMTIMMLRWFDYFNWIATFPLPLSISSNHSQALSHQFLIASPTDPWCRGGYHFTLGKCMIQLWFRFLKSAPKLDRARLDSIVPKTWKKCVSQIIRHHWSACEKKSINQAGADWNRIMQFTFAHS